MCKNSKIIKMWLSITKKTTFVGLHVWKLMLKFMFKKPSTHVQTQCLFLPVDRLEHGWAGQLEQCYSQACSCTLEQTVPGLVNEQTWTMLFGTGMINQQRCSYT